MADKENRRKCFKCGRSPTQHNVKLFRFPKPAKRNLIRCLLWAKYIFPDRDYSLVSFQMKLYSEHRMLCQKHFKDCDFTDSSRTKLLRTAVPSDDQKEHISIPVQDDDSHILIVSDIEEHNLLNFINYECNLNAQLNIKEDLTNTQNISQIDCEDISPASPIVLDFENGFHDTNKEYVTNITKSRKEEKQKCQKIVHLQDTKVPPRAVAVLPPALYYKNGSVIPRRSLPTRVKFGPVKGVKTVLTNENACEIVLEAARCKVPIYLMINNDHITYIDVLDKDKSNWFSLLPLGDQHTANVWLYQEGEELYGMAVKSIAARTPLILGYSKKYTEDCGIPPGLPVLDISSVLCEDLQAQCRETAGPYHRRNGYKNTIRLRTRRGRYRCRYCLHTFSRIFTLNRHTALYCTKKSDKTATVKWNCLPEVAPTAASNIEDNRLPSDESLQNYSNGLDFSTSLFDTDRMSNLEISGSSRSENDFNLYGVSYKDHNGMTVDLDPTVNKQECENEDRSKVEPPNEPFLISCEHCRQTIVQGDMNRHIRECKRISLTCECGRMYKSKEKLAQHIHTQHGLSSLTQKLNEDAIFKCDKCDQTYLVSLDFLTFNDLLRLL
ncbi:unnamed protein product [Diatraea saccharalis]|uniref:C2H2-type domain-containing protein n=1 Tax=Diatraea saccharalis TaxID=40085 RepID=A0A9N9QY17_9NEOP|nr:unnamed protein product [Diatraea saccharalis]